MNIRASYRYQMVDHKKSIIAFYITILLVFIFLLTTMGISIHNNDGTTTASFSGINLFTAIFLFVAALSSYRETLGMMIQNGVSRRTMFFGRILTTVSLALIMATIDILLSLIFEVLASIISDNLTYISIYKSLYSVRAMEVSTFQIYVESFMFSFFMYLAYMAVGYLITTIFYRLNKTGRVLLASGLPVSVFVLIPILDSVVADGRIGKLFIEFLDIALGLTKQIPYYSMISSTLALILLSALSWLFIRKANVRE